MLAKEDFLQRFESYSDEELFKIHVSTDGFSAEAKDAAEIVIERRGGLEKIKQDLKRQRVVFMEVQRIQHETAALYTKDSNPDFLKTLIKSDILPEERTHEIIEAKYAEIQSQKKDMEIRPGTIMGSVVGGILGSVIGGLLWGLHMIQMHRIFYIFIAGLAILSYGLIRAFTKQSRNNTVVLLATILSVIGAILIGQWVFEMYG